MNLTTFEIWTTITNCVVAVANVTLFIVGFWTLRNDRRRIVKMEESDRRKYAENVYAWIEERSSESVTIFCRNGSTSVVYDVRVFISDGAGKPLADTYEIELMKPLEERNFTIQHVPGIHFVSVNLEFRDPGGLNWRRGGDGRLVEDTNERVSEAPPAFMLGQQQGTLHLLPESKRRSLVKTIVWRIIGILWTWIGVYLILLLVGPKYSSASFIATLIVAYHHSTRMFMYYFYERIWLRIKWGRTLEHIPPMNLKEKVLWTFGALTVVLLILYFLMYINPMIEAKKP